MKNVPGYVSIYHLIHLILLVWLFKNLVAYPISLDINGGTHHG